MWPILQSWRPGCSRLGSLCCNGLANASDQWLAATGAAIAHDDAASPLHRVVPSARPHGVGTPPRDDWILPGRRGGQPIRVARRPGPLAQATRAAWIYIAMLTPPASLQAPRRCFSPSAPHGWPSIGALADRRCPATISIYVAIRVEATRSGSYSGYLDLVASLEAWNDGDQQLATKGLSTPQDVRARLLHRVVRAAPPTWPSQCLLRLPLRPDYARSGCHQRHKTLRGQKRPRTRPLQQL